MGVCKNTVLGTKPHLIPYEVSRGNHLGPMVTMEPLLVAARERMN